MLNTVALIGRLTKDVELKTTKSGMSCALITIALDNPVKDADGNTTTTFIPVQVWDKVAENTAKFCHKGSLVGVQGRIQQRTYTNKEKKYVSVLEVVANTVEFLDPKEQPKETKASKGKKEQPQDEDADLPF